MNIAFDAKRITHNSTGLGNYSRYIVDILSDYYPDNNYLLFTPSPGQERLRSKLPQKENIIYKYPTGINKHFKSYWRSRNILHDLKHDQVDIYHGLTNELPVGIEKSGIPSIVTIHDLIFLRYPHFYKYIDRKIYDYKFRKASETADKVIAVSEMTRRDIINYYGIDENKIITIYQGCDDSFRKDSSKEKKEEVRIKYSLPQRYILNVGTIENRKNLMLLIKALPLIKDKDIKVVVVGRKTSYFEDVEKYINEHNLQDRVLFLSGIPFDELPCIYRMATLFVYPSFFEGFGIPIIEAMYSGIPVIGATGSCLEEAGGPDSLYVDPENVGQLVTYINELVNDDALRMKMIENGLSYVQRFNPEVISSQIMTLYKGLK